MISRGELLHGKIQSPASNMYQIENPQQLRTCTDDVTSVGDDKFTIL